MRTKRHRLTFKLEHLAPVKSGAKTCTVRSSAVAARVRPANALTLAFGRYDVPVVLTAAAAWVEIIELEVELSRAFTLPESVSTLVEERHWYELSVISELPVT